VQHISKSEDEFQLEILGRETTVNCDIVIITTGGHPKSQGYDWLRALDLKIIDPVPSLFTFNMPDDPIKTLMGIAVPAHVRIVGSTFNEEGPVLITHWGMSGPAVLRLSAWGARHLSCEGYEFILSINWSNGLSEQGVRELLSTDNRRKLQNANPLQLPVRLWEALMDRASVDANLSWYDSPKKSKNKLINTITQDHYQVSGKTTFKEEFVTCGGVALDQINLSNMSSKDIPGLYLAGEVLDIDAITGGFNFQAAWSTGYVAGMCKP
ncbi:MAG: aminoacetone oxidase family FAD-binding enzyme, partial [Bacteroidota bacterium]